MKTQKTLLVALALLINTTVFSQVGIGTTTPEVSSILDVKTTTQGFLPPRMNDAQRDAITSPAEGLVIFNTSENCLQWYDGRDWFSGCSGSLAFVPNPLPVNIVLESISPYFIASVFDTDYLPYTIPTVAAQLPGNPTADNANGSADPDIDVLGTLSSTGVIIKIPYTVTVATVALPAYSQTITIPAAFTNNNTATAITFEYAVQSLAVGSGSINATLKATTATLEVIQLDLNSGLGNDYLGWLLGAFTYALDNTTSTANFQVRAIPGIPDKKIGQTINGVSYNYLYSLVESATGQLWLNNNLGAAYSTIGSADFNVTQQATALNDFKAYGNLYQWGRASDGHDKINWTSSTAGTAVNGTTTTRADVPPDASFILANANTEWRVNSDNTLWATEASTNNPCPHGWRLPTEAELNAERALFPTQNRAGAANSVLKLPSAGYRNTTIASNGTLAVTGTAGYYWSNTPTPSDNVRTRLLSFNLSNAGFLNRERSHGFSVRCIKD